MGAEVDAGFHDIYLEKGAGLNLSQRHIIPWNALELFWNNLVCNSLFTQCASIISTLAEWVPGHPIVITQEQCSGLKEFADAIKECTFREGVGIAELGKKCNRNFAQVINDVHVLYSFLAVDVFPGLGGRKRRLIPTMLLARKRPTQVLVRVRTCGWSNRQTSPQARTRA